MDTHLDGVVDSKHPLLTPQHLNNHDNHNFSQHHQRDSELQQQQQQTNEQQVTLQQRQRYQQDINNNIDDPSRVQICLVCEDIASGLHYGSVTCDECKNFFEQTVLNNLVYTCLLENNCNTLKQQQQQQTRCQSCRFQKCLRLGLVQAAVKRHENRMSPIGGGQLPSSVYNIHKVKYKKHKSTARHASASLSTSTGSTASLTGSTSIVGEVGIIPLNNHYRNRSNSSSTTYNNNTTDSSITQQLNSALQPPLTSLNIKQDPLDGSNTTIRTLPQIPVPASEPKPLSVNGVGGTITTVTSGTRKTAPLPRLVGKNGTVNLFLDNIDRSQYVRDLFTTMIDIKWRYNLMAATFGFVFSWLFFACIWYSVLLVHNDLAHENDPNWSPCIVNVHSFSAALLFSIETQSTLGFGSRIISVECPGAIVIFCVQLIFGVVIECLIVGMVFAKLTRPAKRSQTIMYSKHATVCLREGQMCLTFRVGDVRSKSHIIGATIRASLVSQKITEEGETIPFYHHQFDVKIDDSKNGLLLIWPVTIVHLIDATSPFYDIDSEQLTNSKFEIITVLEGTVESTGQSIQVRSSYLPSEVKWGYRFEPVVSTHGCGRYAQTIIDYNKFNRIVAVDTPSCSPKEYYSRSRSFEHQIFLNDSQNKTGFSAYS